MGPRSRGGGGGVGMRQRGRGGGPGGPRDRGQYNNTRSGDFSEVDVRQQQQQESQGGFGQIDTWNPMGGSGEEAGPGRQQGKSMHQPQHRQNRQLNNSKDAFDNAGNWGDDFPPAEDWDNDEYTGSLTESKVFTPSGASSAAGKAVGEQLNGGTGAQLQPQQAAVGSSVLQQLPTAANNSLSGSSYSQPIDISTLLQKPGGLAGAPSVAPGGPTASLSQYNQTATQDLKSAIGIPHVGGKVAQEQQLGYGSSFSTAVSTGAVSSGYTASTSTQHNNSSFSSPAPGSAFSPIKPAAVTNGTSSSSKVPRARLPPPSRIPSSAVEMPGDSLSNLDVQFGGLDLQFGASNNDSTSSSNYDFSSAPGAQVNQTPPSNQKTIANDSLESKYASHSIPSQQKPDQLPSVAPGSSPLDSYKAPGVQAPGSAVGVKDVNQSLSSALSAAGIKQSASSDNVPGFGRSEQSSRPDSKSAASYGVPGAGVPGQTQRSPGPLLNNTKADTLGYNGPSYSYQPSNQSQAGKSTGNYSSSGYPSSASSYERQNSSGYSSTNGLGNTYGSGSGSGSNSTYSANSTVPGNFSSSGYNSVSQPANNSSFSNSGYGSSSAATTNSYSPYTSNNSYSKSATPSTSYNAAATTASASSLSQYPESSVKTGSGYESSVSSSSNVYSGSNSVTSTAGNSLGLVGSSSVSNSSKMGGMVPPTTSTTGKMMPGAGMPPGVASVLPAQYMIGGTAGGFPAYLAAGLGQAPAMYGYGGHQLEDLAALQRSTLAASLPQLVGAAAANVGAPGTANPASQQTGGHQAKGPSSGYYDPSSQFSGSGNVAGGSSLGGRGQLGGVGVASDQQSQQGFGGVGGQPGAQQQDNGQVSKFGGVSDTTSSPVPSTVAASGQQQPPFSALASTFAAPAPQQHPTLPPGYAYFYGGVGGMPGALQAAYGGGVGAGVYPATHPVSGIPVNTAAGATNTTQFQQNKPYGSSYGTSYDSLSLGQSNSGYGQKNSYGQNESQGSKASSGNNTTGYWSSALW